MAASSLLVLNPSNRVHFYCFSFTCSALGSVRLLEGFLMCVSSITFSYVMFYLLNAGKTIHDYGDLSCF